MYETIKQQTIQALTELLDYGHARPGDLVVIGCSSSEIVGATIGHGTVPEAAAAAAEAALSYLTARGLYLAAQCCEHLNRALIIERAAAEKYGYEEVCVVPQPKAGGSFATAVYGQMQNPVAVEHIRAAYGLDIGDTFIGMHLKDVAVPVRLTVTAIGSAHLTAAYTRPKLIGGARAVYER